MKSVLGYLNPMNVMRLKGPSAADRLYEVINFEFEHEHLIWFDKYNNINEEDQYEMGGNVVVHTKIRFEDGRGRRNLPLPLRHTEGGEGGQEQFHRVRGEEQ